MEIKLRTRVSTVIPGAEKWIKEKLGKSDLSAYQSQIYELLDKNNLPQDHELFERNLICKVQKERYGGTIAGVYFEITFLQLQFPSFVSYNSRDWISISFEGSEDALFQLLRAPDSPVLRWIVPCILSLHSICTFSASNALAHRFYAILSGYPAWLNSLISPDPPSTAPLLALLAFFHVPLPPRRPRPLPSSASPPENSQLFDWSSQPSLETSRLLLRDITMDHLDDIFQIRSNSEVTKYTIGFQYTSTQQAKDLIEGITLDFQQKKALRWGIVKKEDPNQRVVGMIGFNYWNTVDHRGSVGYDLMHSEWGQGFMQESLERLLEFGFVEMKMNRIEAVASAGNDLSIKLLKKVGFVVEGIQREQYYENEGYHDLVCFALLKREWSENNRKSLFSCFSL
jgi:[ribosomal protein S5]-alanine N-acetyltransferase